MLAWFDSQQGRCRGGASRFTCLVAGGGLLRRRLQRVGQVLEVVLRVCIGRRASLQVDAPLMLQLHHRTALLSQTALDTHERRMVAEMCATVTQATQLHAPALMDTRQQSSCRGCASAMRRSRWYTDAKLRSQAGRNVLPQPKVSDRSLPVPSGSTYKSRVTLLTSRVFVGLVQHMAALMRLGKHAHLLATWAVFAGV